MKYLTSIDWLSISCNCDYNLMRSLESYKPLNFGNSIFKEQAHFACSGVRFASVQFNPHASILDSDLAIIKIENACLYSSNLNEIVSCLLKDIKARNCKVSRIDICADFQESPNFQSLSELMKQIDSREVIYAGRGKMNTYANIEKQTEYEYVRFGTHASSICKYIYNKTLELKQVHDKEYIREFWRENGFDELKTTWRVEFSLKPCEFEGFDCFKDLNSLEAITEAVSNENVRKQFNRCFENYMKLRINEEGQRTARMKPLKIIEIDDAAEQVKYKRYAVDSNASAYKKAKAYVNMMLEMVEVDCAVDERSFRTIFEVIEAKQLRNLVS